MHIYDEVVYLQFARDGEERRRGNERGVRTTAMVFVINGKNIEFLLSY